jgi:hypothetical protein
MLVFEDVHQIRSGYHGMRLHLVKLAEEDVVVGRVNEDGVWWSWKGEASR